MGRYSGQDVPAGTSFLQCREHPASACDAVKAEFLVKETR